jgi:hypothetical protein
VLSKHIGILGEIHRKNWAWNEVPFEILEAGIRHVIEYPTGAGRVVSQRESETRALMGCVCSQPSQKFGD